MQLPLLLVNSDVTMLVSDMVLFAQLSEDTIIDKIPLIEIKAVKEMTDVHDGDQKSKDGNDFMIETSTEGYNSGRTYYFQADSKAACKDASNKISHNSRQAIDRANAKTAFTQAQQQVKKVYKSAVFKNIVAFLILSVGMNFPQIETCMLVDTFSCNR